MTATIESIVTARTRRPAVGAIAANANDASTPDRIGLRRADGRDPARIALERWESDGGASYSARQSRSGRTNGSAGVGPQARLATIALR
jgi:GAF domain-containing protein